MHEELIKDLMKWESSLGVRGVFVSNGMQGHVMQDIRRSCFALSQDAETIARLRKAIEDFVNTDYEDMTIESIQSDMRKAIGE